MKHLTVGVFHDDTLSRELGKKDTETDIVILNRKIDQHILTFMYPLEDKLSAKSEIVSSIDAAIVTFTEMTRELGETIVMLDSLGVSRGMAVASPYATDDRIATLLKDTALRSYTVQDREPVNILQMLKEINPERDTASSPVVVVDHSFSVKGVGEVILGFVKKGIVRKYDKLSLLPAGKEVIVRSIQMQDEDYDEAEAGSRVGLAIKGATVDEMQRGAVFCIPGEAKTATTVDLSFQKSPFYGEPVRDGAFHTTVGMQTIPVTVTKKNGTSVTIESDKPIVYTTTETFLLLDLNAKKMRIIGKGTALQN
jgi:selenocysteine-specific translation elongation factor